MKKKILLFAIACATAAFIFVSCSQSSSCPTYSSVKPTVNNKYKR